MVDLVCYTKSMQKPKLREKQFFLVVNGPSCGGKSTVTNLLIEEYGNIFQAKSDAIKWLISDYDSSLHREVVHEMTLATVRTALQNGLSVLSKRVRCTILKYTKKLHKNLMLIFML